MYYQISTFVLIHEEITPTTPYPSSYTAGWSPVSTVAGFSAVCRRTPEVEVRAASVMPVSAGA